MGPWKRSFPLTAMSVCTGAWLLAGCWHLDLGGGGGGSFDHVEPCPPSRLADGVTVPVDAGVWPPERASAFPRAACDPARDECAIRALYGGGGEYAAGNHCLTNAQDETLCFGWPRDFTPDGGVPPVEVVRRDVIDVDVGASFRCFRSRAGELRCEGYSDLFEVVLDPRSDGVHLFWGLWLPEWLEADGVDASGVGGTMLCYVRNGIPSCRGYTGYFPYPGVASELGVLVEPTAVLGLPVTHDVAVGMFSACALSIAGEVHCWGSNDSGQLGRPNDPGSARPVAIDVPPLAALRAGAAAYAGLDFVGGVWLWGTLSRERPDEISAEAGRQLYCCREASGALGEGCYAPARVDGLPGPAIDVGVGREHACALLEDGRVFCWGGNRSGQLGQGDVIARAQPTYVPLGFTVEHLSVTRLGTCASGGDALWCWGDDDQDNLHVGPADVQCEGGDPQAGNGWFDLSGFFPCVLEPRPVLDYPPAP